MARPLSGFGPFETRRLRLDPLSLDDAEPIAALHADPRVSEKLLDGVPRTPAEARIFIRWAETLAPRQVGVVAARRHGSDTLLGLFSLTPFEGSDDIELGGKLARAGWGSGLAFEAGARLIDHAFGVLECGRLVSAYHPENRSVPAILGRLGFCPAGEADVFGRPACLMRLSRDEWPVPTKRND